MDIDDLIAAKIMQSAGEREENCDCKACVDRRSTKGLAPGMRARRILDHYADIRTRHTFKPGDVITLKRGLDPFKMPRPGDPCIVVEILSDPIVAEHDDSIESGAKLDMRTLVLSPRGVPTIMVFESFLFEPYTGDIEPGGEGDQ
jgi:hypothetical protein